VVTTSNKQLAGTLSALAKSPGELESAAGQATLTQALAARDTALLVQAASLIAQHQLSVHELTLRKAYAHTDAVSARTALVAALEAIESQDAELFAEAAQHVQLERNKDTAATLRARAILALARTGHGDWLPIVGACLGDRDDTVRLSAARAIAHRGQRDGAGLLLLRLGAGDSVAEVRAECLRGLFAIAPDLGERYAKSALQTDKPEELEHVLHALGTAASDSAVALLDSELARRSLADERVPVIAALGLSLRPKARTLLLELVQSDRSSDAQAALSALAIHRYDTRLAAQLRELTASSKHMSRRVSELFGD
jgi:hypothetical protein